MSLEDLKESVRRHFLIASHIAKHEIDKVLYQNTGRSIFYGSYSPPKVLEGMTGFTGISCDYNLPDDEDCWELERSFSLGRMSIDEFRAIATEMIDLNPELENLRQFLDDERYPIDICYGVTSGFNVDDIYFFLTSNKDMDGLKERFVNVQAYKEGLGLEVIPWIASPQTLENIAVLSGKSKDWKPSADDYKAAMQAWQSSTAHLETPEEAPDLS